jgi:hypothetical protein
VATKSQTKRKRTSAGASASAKSKPAREGRSKPERLKLARISDDMKYLCSMLGEELTAWPNVTTKSMFGMQAFYRNKEVFAALPATRAIGDPNAIIFKMKKMSASQSDRATHDARLCTGTKIKAQRWHSFDVHSEDDLRDALWWLGQAYETAK